MDNLLTANSLTNLSFYYFGMKRGKEAFNCMLHALYLYSVVGGESHQDVFNQFTNLSLLYSESGQHQAAINCLFEALDRCENLHKGNHSNSMVKIAGYYQAIALEHSELGDVQKAVEFQNRAVGLITQVALLAIARCSAPTIRVPRTQTNCWRT
jgi:protein TIF31